jgi:hypothetical protein
MRTGREELRGMSHRANSGCSVLAGSSFFPGSAAFVSRRSHQTKRSLAISPATTKSALNLLSSVALHPLEGWTWIELPHLEHAKAHLRPDSRLAAVGELASLLIGSAIFSG